MLGYEPLNLAPCITQSPCASPPPLLRPIDVAYTELAYSLERLSSREENPRIALYHASVSDRRDLCGGTPWCSSFVNFCVRQAGLKGTGSMMARSWHDTAWGTAVSPEDALAGDIVVFAKPGRIYGHVAFYHEGDVNGAVCIGGNQRHRVGKRSYDFHNPMLKLLSIRRPPVM